MTTHQSGTDEWIEEVFASPPARDVQGRSRPTTRFHVSAGGNEAVEGKTASLSRLVLSSAINCGLIKRYKFEPCALCKETHGVDAIPDILFEHADNRRFFVEAKAERHLARPADIEKARAVAACAQEAGINYLFWTDLWPLVKPLGRILRSSRRCGTASVPAQQVENLVQRVDRGDAHWDELRDAGIFRDAILHAFWTGRVHLNLFEDPCDKTIVSSNIATRSFDTLLGAGINSHEWWYDLLPLGR